MTQTLDINGQLTEDERQKVQAYAESLIASRSRDDSRNAPKFINVDALLGMFAGMGGERSDKELIREAWDELASKYDK